MVPKTEAENERLLGIVEALMEKGEARLTPEEDALLELLTRLIREFEATAYSSPRLKSQPREIVAFLLEQRGLKPSALWDLIGSKGRVSDMLASKRAISKEQAKKLAGFFGVAVGLFL